MVARRRRAVWQQMGQSGTGEDRRNDATTVGELDGDWRRCCLEQLRTKARRRKRERGKAGARDGETQKKRKGKKQQKETTTSQGKEKPDLKRGSPRKSRGSSPRSLSYLCRGEDCGERKERNGEREEGVVEWNFDSNDFFPRRVTE